MENPEFSEAVTYASHEFSETLTRDNPNVSTRVCIKGCTGRLRQGSRYLVLFGK